MPDVQIDRNRCILDAIRINPTDAEDRQRRYVIRRSRLSFIVPFSMAECSLDAHRMSDRA